MRRPYQILMPLLGLFLVRVDLTDLFPLKIPVEVLKIYDGDTLLVRHGSFTTKLRLSKVDAPEKKQPFLIGKGDAGKVAADCLKRVLSNQNNVLIIEKQDMYGRILGDLNGLSYSLIEQGCVSLYPYASFADQSEKYRYLRALKTAKAAHRGLWKYNGFLQPKKWRKLSKRVAHRP